MLKVFFVFLISLTSFSQSYKDLKPNEYQYRLKNSLPFNWIEIELKNGKTLIFKKIKEDCDPYADSCFLDFSNKNNSEFELYGVDPCSGNECKEEHPNFPNYGIILRKII